MDPRSKSPAASSLLFLCRNLTETIKSTTRSCNAAPTTISIDAECSAINATLLDIQSLLSQPHALSSRVISPAQLEEAFKNAQSGCNLTASRLEVEAGKCAGNRTPTRESRPRTWSMPPVYDEALIKGLLQQIERQLADISLLIVAVQRNSSSQIKQLLKNDTFIGDLIDITEPIDTLTPSSSGRYSQGPWGQFDSDAKSITARTNTSVSGYSFRSEPSLLDNDDDTSTIVSRSSIAPPRSDITRRAPRPQKSSMFFNVFRSNTELHRAAKKGDAKKLKALLDVGVDINYEGASGCTALHLATDCGHEAVVKVLLDNGADPTAKSSEGRTPLHSAARTGHTAVVRMLLEKGVDVRSKDPSGSTALHIAAYNGHESVVQILLEKHPYVEEKGPSGFTALHVASFSGQSAVVRLLVEMGAIIEARSHTGKTALQLAADKGHEAVVRHLLLHGANVMAKDSNGRTAFEGAISNGHGVVAQLLLERAVPESTSHWQQRDSGSGPICELPTDEPQFSMAELDSTDASTFSQQGSNAVFELPATEVSAGVKSTTSRSRWNPLASRKKTG